MTPCIDYLLLLFLPRIYSKPFASHSSTASVLLFLQPTALRKHFHKCSSWTFLKTEELNRDGDTITEQWGAINYFVTINVATPKPDCRSRKKPHFSHVKRLEFYTRILLQIEIAWDCFLTAAHFSFLYLSQFRNSDYEQLTALAALPPRATSKQYHHDLLFPLWSAPISAHTISSVGHKQPFHTQSSQWMQWCGSETPKSCNKKITQTNYHSV